MSDLQQLRSMVEEKLSALPLAKQPNELYDPIAYTLSMGGKRMRPVLTLMGCNLFGGNPQNALSAAAAIEVFHNFTLLHDDIMDNAPLRRNKPTVHEKWNSNIAILSGDVMLVLAYQLMMESEKSKIPAILEVFSDTAVLVCEGQQMDMNFEHQDNVAIADYLTMIGYKTAVLLGASIKIGALLANAEESAAAYAYTFGKDLGIAFQLQDDLLDVYGDPEKFGKQVGGDIISNKKTYLLLKAMELATGNTAQELNRWIDSTDFDPQEKVEAVKSIYAELGIADLTRKEMDRFYDHAIHQMKKIPVADPQKAGLMALAESLMVREV